MAQLRSTHLRKARVSEAGRAYLLTTVTRARHPVFADFLCARTAIKCLQACDAQNFTETLAYVLMPDHLHWLFVLQQGELSDAMRRFKPNAAHAVNLMRGSVGQTLWQPGFHDRAIRHDDDLPTIACYVVANPIRAGLTRSVASYAHWDAVWF